MALAAFVLTGCPEETETNPPPPDEEPKWEEAFDTSDAGSLSGVWGSGPDDVFIVGGSDDGGEIYHYDGTSWSPMTLPAGTPLMVWSYGFGPSDVYSVGLEGAMLHYDGSSWSAIDTGTTEQLWGIFGFSPSDLWIVGGDPFTDDPLILHYDGSTFTPHVVEASENLQGAKSLFKVWGIDGTVYAVGQKGLILRFDGSAWKAMPAGAKADQDFVSLWGTRADHIVAVGGRGNGRIATFDGQSWTTVAPNALGGLNAVHMVEDDVAVIGGILGFAGRFEVGSGEVVNEADGLTRVDIHAIWGDGQGTHWAVGGSFISPHQGVALKRTAP
ncbi:MAG: hypothetical protein KC731_00875 [Myxococcales bacterium]|nr:hypothetical protein [Myxococcales bacterium]